MMNQHRQNILLQLMPRARNYACSPSVSINTQAWLTLAGSLTRHLKHHFDAFHVVVLSEQWQKPLRSEARLLRIPFYQKTWIRSVHLYGNGQPQVYARTVLPEETMNFIGHRMRRLASKPLGEFLFCHPHIKRDKFHRMRLDPKLPAFAQAYYGTDYVKPSRVDGRASIFSIHQHPILVSEYFIGEMPTVKKRFFSHGK